MDGTPRGIALTDMAALGGDAQRADVVIVGTGIAAMGAALPAARAGLSVLMLESGQATFDAAAQSLNDLDFAGKPHRALDPDASYHPYLPPHLRGSSRLRQLGGTSNLWTGKWKWMEPAQLAGRDWMPDTDWPLTWEELRRCYRETAAEYGLGDAEAEERRPELVALRDRIAPHGLRLSTFHWEATPTRAGDRLTAAMRDLPNLRVVQGATATELRRGPDGAIDAVLCRGAGGATMTARGACVILAAGAIETARLMMVSRGPGGDGIGGELVGRYYLDHVKAQHLPLRPGPLMDHFAPEFRYAPKPRACLMLGLDTATQAAESLGDHGIYLKPRYASRREVLRGLLSGGALPRDGNGRVRAYHVKIACEQRPNPDSRVRLSDTVDALGVPRAVLDWRFTEADHASVDRIVELARDRLAAAGLGQIDFGGALPGIDQMTDAAHHMGTTRMSAAPASGVVDPDCRVWGVPNLYVAGSAVFPSGPIYSPTLTILALARRLGQHVAATRHALA